VRARDRPNAGAGMCVDAFQDVPWRATVFCSVYWYSRGDRNRISERFGC